VSIEPLAVSVQLQLPPSGGTDSPRGAGAPPGGVGGGGGAVQAAAGPAEPAAACSDVTSVAVVTRIVVSRVDAASCLARWVQPGDHVHSVTVDGGGSGGGGGGAGAVLLVAAAEPAVERRVSAAGARVLWHSPLHQQQGVSLPAAVSGGQAPPPGIDSTSNRLLQRAKGLLVQRPLTITLWRPAPA
jgi:hypothetical protein